MPWLGPRFSALLDRLDSRTARIERCVEHLHIHAQNLENLLMASDRDLLTAIASTVDAIGPAVDALAADRDTWRGRALAAEGREATDEAGDTAAAQPIKDALDALRTKLAPVAPAEPAPAIEDVPGVVDGAPAPSENDGDDTAAQTV